MNPSINQAYLDFFNKKISFLEFKNHIDSYLSAASLGELKSFYDETVNNPFMDYNDDMVMLTYIYIWMIPNRLNQYEHLEDADNMYLSFMKSILDEYDFPNEFEIINENFNYLIYHRGNIYIMLNMCETDIKITVPEELQNGTHFCINCNDDIKINKQLELYPYGFYLIEK